MNTTMHPTLDDIVFENRNRAYGAYMLRKLYEPTLTRAAGIGVGLFLLAVSAPTLYARLIDRNTKQEIMVEVNPEKFKMEPLPEKIIEISHVVDPILSRLMYGLAGLVRPAKSLA